MADFGFNLNLGPQAKQTSLGEMLNLASGAQQLQQAQQINPLQVQEAQQRVQAGNITLGKSRQEEQERLAMQEFMSNPENYQTNGRIDINKLNLSIPRIAPLTGQKHISDLTTLGEAQTKGIEAKNKLSTTQRAIIAGPVAMLGRMGINDPRVYIQELNHLKEMHKDQKDINDLIDVEIGLLSKSKEGPHISQGAIRSAQSLLTPESQEAQFSAKPGLVNTGGSIVPTVTTPSVAGSTPNVQVGGGAPIPTTLAPNQKIVPTGRVDINNNPTAYVYDSAGNLLGEQTIPGIGGQQPAPIQPPAANAPQGQAAVQPPPQATTPPPARMRPGETTATYEAANKMRTDAQNAAGQVPLQLFNNNKIIELADKATTGKGADLLANLTGGYAGLPFGGDMASNLNQLGHYMALQTSTLAQSAGLNSDAGRAIAGQMSGTTEWTPDAIKKTARVNRALATATDLVNRGIQNAFNKSNDPLSARDFQNKWSQVADMEAIQLYDAIKNGSRTDIKYAVDSMGGPNSEKYKKTLQKINFMNSVLKGQ
jgi:YD repeat-containing protein